MEATQDTGTSTLDDISARLMDRWSQDDVAVEAPATVQDAITKPVTEREPAPVEAAEVEGDDAEVEEPEGEDTEEATQEPDESEEASFSTVSELAEALELSPEDLLDTLKTRIKASGEEHEVTLAEAIKGYQREADYTRKTKEIAEDRRVLEKQQQQADEAYQLWQNQMKDAVTTVDIASQVVMGEYSNTDWERLKVEDPTQYVIKQQEYQQRNAQLNQHKQMLFEQQQQVHNQRMAELIPKEREALIRSIPEWTNEEVFDTERRQLADYAVQQGYSQEQVDNLVDHKAVVMLRKAMLYDMAKSAPEPKPVKKVTRKISKNLKPGARTSATTVKQEALDKAKKRLKRSGSPNDMANVLLERWS